MKNINVIVVKNPRFKLTIKRPLRKNESFIRWVYEIYSFLFRNDKTFLTLFLLYELVKIV